MGDWLLLSGQFGALTTICLPNCPRVFETPAVRVTKNRGYHAKQEVPVTTVRILGFRSRVVFWKRQK
jgi:hypothetical protein